MHLPDIPGRRAMQDPDAAIVADDTTVYTAATFDAAVVRAARVLAAAGLTRGTVVAVVVPNTADLVVALFAAWRLGAAATPVNPALGRHEIAYQLGDCAARVVVTIPELTAAIPEGFRVVTDLHAAADAGDPPVGSDVLAEPDDLALLIYTSGTTGKPKGVMLDHANLSAMVSSSIAEMSMDSTAHSLLILPLFHVNGIVAGVMSALAAGGRTTIAGRFDPRTLFDRVEAARPTFFSAVPAIYAMLVDLPETVTPDTSSLRYVICGAAPASAEVLRRFESRYGVPVIEGYGLSEGTCASTLNPVDGPRKPGTVGRAMPGQTVRIVDADGETITDGRPGEVLIQGPNVMRGYLGRPEETAKTLVDGWLHTGDVGFLDDEGYLTLVDRSKDMIIRNGENIYPREIESVVYLLDGVREAAVVGRPHPTRGEEPVLFVSLNRDASLTEDAIDAHIAEHLARYKRPVTITVVDDIPKNPVGKIDKPSLRRQVAPVA
ncbi:class I adenylate-forming enzyme family protein [Williamsia serinedens]|uniref:Acyl-CoA synthetase (AMP-forming)/AMP-acid ligase II n=1 Tax=Williamsia serinedens TaxID=391736 RepID=A0ABT1H5V1_9NOCA|nr:AMP-binding protein [Williamsia serinedens]MCP2162619.1 Acyl-CoA synthetase (AMP-forming)/AMP-acid ligase II [Williamsia serinedens]